MRIHLVRSVSFFKNQSERPALRKPDAVLRFMVAKFGMMLFREAILKYHPIITIIAVTMTITLATFTYCRKEVKP
jgi:hypothetical protein